MQNISLDLSNTLNLLTDLDKYKDEVKNLALTLKENQMTGWMDYPNSEQLLEIEKIKKLAKKVRDNSSYLVCIGIGGSYLGAKAIIDALSNDFCSFNKTKVLYAGNNLDSTYLYELIDFIKDKDFSINVISKSGTTLEPSLAFRLLKELLQEKYGDFSKDRIIVTTDKEKGLLNKLALEKGYETLIIPSNIGGRYSVLTPVGLFPLAVAGVNIDKLLKGFENGKNNYNEGFNICYKYACARHILENNGKDIELLVSYNPKLSTFAEWWKQLFGESEGKDLKGIFPSSASFTTDLHSLGQYIQDGKRIMFETVINVEKVNNDITIPFIDNDLDKLNYLSGKSISYINKKAMEGTIKAHTDGGVPNIIINISSLCEDALGELIYFFFLSCAISSLLIGVNPFNQPGVEKYKNNMFRLLEK